MAEIGYSNNGRFKRLADIIADGFAELDDIAEAAAPKIDERKKELLLNPKKRDLKMWAAIGVEKWLFGHTIDSINKAAKGVLDDKWAYAISGLIAACFAQARDEIVMLDILESSEKTREQVIPVRSEMTRIERIAFGKEGIAKELFESAKEKRRGARS